MDFNSTKKTLYALLPLSAFCFLLRYLQRKNELLADGSLADGAYLHYILLVLCGIAVIGSAVLLFSAAKYTSWEQFYNHKVMTVILFGAAGMLLIANVLFWISGTTPASVYSAASPYVSDFLNKLSPPLSILAAACIGLFAYCCYLGRKPSPLFYMCVSLYLVVRLIVCFQAWNTDPSIHDYCFALLANICTMLATFHLAGFSFGKGKRRITLFWTLCAFLFTVITLADALYDGDLGELLIHSALILLTGVNGIQLLLSTEDCSA